MSIASEIERITGAVSDQSDLIAQISSALEGKAAGGGSGGVDVDTCTVTLICSYGLSKARVTYADAPGVYVEETLSGTTTNLDNVVCGSLLTVSVNGHGSSTFAASAKLTGAELMDYSGSKSYSASLWALFKITAENGGTATIIYTSSDPE